MTRTVAKKLAEARKLIERGWTQHYSAANDAGEQCSYDEATCFCAFGAVAAVDRNYRDRHHMLDLLNAVVGDGIIDFNDTPGRTQAEVIEAFKRAEQLAGAE